ncbi:MAG: COX15/CtaA family protein [Rhodoferax sp.]|nr:COX15/CtaA family protein [Rhodoferax sp.]
MDSALWNLSPLGQLVLIGMAVAAMPLTYLLWSGRHRQAGGWHYALTLTTLFLTFDLVLFGAFTRLTDSGLGCPDWPGCYGHASPVGAKGAIALAQTVNPEGPVTHSKAWIEMLHRYLASGVGMLIVLLAISAWRDHRKAQAAQQRLPIHPAWATATLVWVCVQGGFGALTVTMKLFPAIVTMHLLGGYVLLGLLTLQAAQLWLQAGARQVQAIAPSMRVGLWLALAALLLQAALGGWVSTNYAVLACMEFPTCQGSHWPAMDFAQGFTLWRPLGLQPDGQPLSFEALTAIHMVHRWMAAGLVLVIGLVLWQLRAYPALRRPMQLLGLLLALQLLTGLSNVVLGWPLLAAVLHTGGAGAMLVCLVWLLTVSRVPVDSPVVLPKTLRPAT